MRYNLSGALKSTAGTVVAGDGAKGGHNSLMLSINHRDGLRIRPRQPRLIEPPCNITKAARDDSGDFRYRAFAVNSKEFGFCWH